MDMREEASGRVAGFFMAEEGTGIDEYGSAFPAGPSEARVRRLASMYVVKNRYRRVDV
jgi:hypothetical protein